MPSRPTANPDTFSPPGGLPPPTFLQDALRLGSGASPRPAGTRREAVGGAGFTELPSVESPRDAEFAALVARKAASRMEPWPLGLSLHNKLDGVEPFHRGISPDTIVLETAVQRLTRMKRGVLTFARLCEEQWAGRRHQVVMVTLTYRPADAWGPRDISEFSDRLRQWCRRREIECAYTWVMETTARGVPHYHVLVWLPIGIHLPKADKRGWWTHGMTRTERAKCAIGYIAKYASKGFDHPLPAGGRISGCAGLTTERRRERAWWMLPAFARDIFSVDDDVRRACGGGFVSRATGEWIESPWLLVSMGHGRVRLTSRAPPP